MQKYILQRIQYKEQIIMDWERENYTGRRVQSIVYRVENEENRVQSSADRYRWQYGVYRVQNTELGTECKIKGLMYSLPFKV